MKLTAPPALLLLILDADGPLDVATLAEQVDTAYRAVGAQVGQLVAAGLVEVARIDSARGGRGNRRNVWGITAAGRAFVARDLAAA